MIQVTIVTTTDRTRVTVDPNDTVRTALEENDINYELTQLYIDGVKPSIGDLDKSFAELGIAEKCTISAIVKADNA